MHFPKQQSRSGAAMGISNGNDPGQQQLHWDLKTKQ
jgi:hypothetical protein